MKQILVIDNNANNVKLVTFILNKSGYRTIVASDGKTGIDLAKKNRPDFILIDMKFSDMSCLEVLQEIRKSDISQNTPVIAMISSATDTSTKESLMEAGFTGCIERPINSLKVIEQLKLLNGN